MIALALVALALAQERDCKDPQTQAEMNYCAAEDFRRADVELNRIWPQALAYAREQDRHINRDWDNQPTSERVLRDAQRAWITFRDAQCTFEGHGARGGSMETMISEGCRARVTEERVRQLRSVVGN